MWDVPEVGYGDPQLEVLNLLLIGLILYLDAPAVAYKVELLLVELIDLLEGHQFILFPEPCEVQIELSYHDGLREVLNNRRIYRYLNLEYS